MLRDTDAHVRRRPYALVLRDWKYKRAIARRLISLGVKPKAARSPVDEGRKSWWTLSATSAVARGLRDAHFAEWGFASPDHPPDLTRFPQR